jgi:hypothetical protein
MLSEQPVESRPTDRSSTARSKERMHRNSRLQFFLRVADYVRRKNRFFNSKHSFLIRIINPHCHCRKNVLFSGRSMQSSIDIELNHHSRPVWIGYEWMQAD